MKNKNKTLHFNDIPLTLVFADGDWWVAIKPICQALGVQFNAQHQRILKDEILSELSRKQEIVAADDAVREMLCLPEKFIYGWLFSIRSDSEKLLKYKRECYEVLWNHFHARFSALVEKVRIDEEIAEREKNLATNEDFQKIRELEDFRKKLPSKLRKMDQELLSGQIKMDV